jgi:hypothetical protein
MTDKCHLCHKARDLCDSHVWPKFAYKRYVSDQTRGGQFVDLTRQRLSNRQYKRPWFCGGKGGCEEILGKDETYVAGLCDQIEEDTAGEVVYDERMLRFATSATWRAMKFHYEQLQPRAIESRWEAYSHWKRFLRGSRPGVAPFTQHVFLLSSEECPFKKALGGVVQETAFVVVSQIGPLLFAGLLAPQRLSDEEKRIWKNSQIQREGGIVRPLKAWKLGRGTPETCNVTMMFAAVLMHQEQWIIDNAMKTQSRA